MDINEIMKLIQAVSDSELTSFELEEGNVKVSLKREKEVPQIVNVTTTGGEQTAPAVMAVNTAVAAPVPAAAPAPAQDQVIASDKVVNSPLVGTFYNASSPDAAPFVQVGDSVKKGQVLGIIEAMKLMNEIESEYDGVVEAILVGNEDVVEYGQPLFRIR